MCERGGKNQIPACLICEHIIILILGFVRLPASPRAQQVARLCESCGPEQIESAGAVNRCMAQSSSLGRGGDKKQTNASHYCSARLCSALGNPSQSTQIQLLLLNQFEAAATSHLSQQQTGASGRLCTQQQLLLVARRRLQRAKGDGEELNGLAGEAA